MNMRQNYKQLTNQNFTNQNNTGDTSRYLKCILDPASGPSGIPDFNMTTSHPKSTMLNTNIVVAGSGQGLFVYLPHSNGSPLKFFIWVNGKYVYATDINYDQDLSMNYTIGRFVSGLLSVKSATTSGTLFNVSGTINASSFQECPDIATLTYNQVTAYKRNNVDCVAAATISDGVVTLAIPDGDETYVPFSTSNTYSSENEIYTTIADAYPLLNQGLLH